MVPVVLVAVVLTGAVAALASGGWALLTGPSTDGDTSAEVLPVEDARVHVNLFSGRSNPVVRIEPGDATDLWAGLDGLEATSSVFDWYGGDLGFRGFIVTAEDAEQGQVAVEVRPGNVLITQRVDGGAVETHLLDPDDTMMRRVAVAIDGRSDEPAVAEVVEPWLG